MKLPDSPILRRALIAIIADPSTLDVEITANDGIGWHVDCETTPYPSCLKGLKNVYVTENPVVPGEWMAELPT